MRAEQILTEVNRAAALLEQDQRETFSYVVKRRLYSLPFDTAGGVLGLLAVSLARDIEASAARSAGTLDQKRALERIVKSAKTKGARSALHGSFPAKNGARAVCDGSRAVRIKNAAVPMPDPIPEDHEPMDVDKCFPEKADCKPCTLPDVPDLRSALKIAKAEFDASHPGRKKPAFLTVWKIKAGDGLEIYVDGQFLLDMLEALPGAAGTCQGRKYGLILFDSPDGDGLLCPVHYDPSEENNKYKLLNG